MIYLCNTMEFAMPSPTTHRITFACLMVASLLCVSCATAQIASQKSPDYGDRNIAMNVVYPDAAFKTNGGPVINIKAAPFNAKGDGVTDDTQAFIRALNFIAEDLFASRGNRERGKYRWRIYLPNGIYLVSDTLAPTSNSGRAGFCGLRLIGQDRNQTVIKLKDNASGFEAGNEKYVLPWHGDRPGQGNVLWGNQARNFTIDTGKGNPGAIAMSFMGANGSAIDNVTLRSGDGTGRVGLDFNWWSVQGHYCDITVEGFEIGIRGTDQRETQPNLEYITLINQREAGMKLGPHAASIRKLHSRNKVPALVIDHDASQTVLVDAHLEGTANAGAAIVVKNAPRADYFLRDVKVTGYAATLSVNGKDQLTGYIDEHVAGKVMRSTPNSPSRSMNLPVGEVRLIEWEQDFNQWVRPDDMPGETEAAKVQAAFDSGKSVVYFPRNYNTGKQTFTIPATVKYLNGMDRTLSRGCTFIIDEASDAPLWIEHTSGRPTFIVKQPRTLRIRTSGVAYRVETDQPVSVYFENIAVLFGGDHEKFCPPNVKMYARSINEESRRTPNWTVNGGLMWVLGFKTEHRQPSFTVRNQGILEVLGGYQNMTARPKVERYPMLINDGGHVSFIGCTFMSRTYPWAIWNKTNDMMKQYPTKKMPRRLLQGMGGTYFVPLFTSYDANTVRERSKTTQ